MSHKLFQIYKQYLSLKVVLNEIGIGQHNYLYQYRSSIIDPFTLKQQFTLNLPLVYDYGYVENVLSIMCCGRDNFVFFSDIYITEARYKQSSLDRYFLLLLMAILFW